MLASVVQVWPGLGLRDQWRGAQAGKEVSRGVQRDPAVRVASISPEGFIELPTRALQARQ